MDIKSNGYQNDIGGSKLSTGSKFSTILTGF